MSNGYAAALLPLPQAPSAPERTSAPASPVELEIGQAIFNASRVLCAGMINYQQTGVLAPAMKEAGGNAIAEIVRLQMRYDGEINFDAVARKRGREALLPLVDGPEFTPGRGEALIDTVIDGALAVARRVVALEKAWAN